MRRYLSNPVIEAVSGGVPTGEMDEGIPLGSEGLMSIRVDSFADPVSPMLPPRPPAVPSPPSVPMASLSDYL